MLKQKNTDQGELLNTQSNVKETHKENYSKEQINEMVSIEDIENTPFKLVTVEEKKSFIGIAGNRLSPLFDTKKEATEYLKTNMWDIIMHLCIITHEKLGLLKNLQKLEEEKHPFDQG